MIVPARVGLGVGGVPTIALCMTPPSPLVCLLSHRLSKRLSQFLRITVVRVRVASVERLTSQAILTKAASKTISIEHL